MILYDTFALDGVRRTADGYLAAFARVARTGIQEYRGHELGRPDLDRVRVYRPPEEVFHEDALRSFAHRPVTLTHPKTPVTAKNWKRYARGQTGEAVVRDGEYVRVPMVMMDQGLIDAYEKQGVKELSMGYSTDLQWRTGVVDAGQPDAGQHYDAVQTAIRGNHLAVVPLARGGDRLRVGDTDFRRLIKRLGDMDEDEEDDEDEDDGDYTGDSRALYDTDFTEEQRKHLSETGAAMPGGGFPIRNAEDLHHAMEAIGRAKDPSAARAHIRERAKALGLESELSASFKDAQVNDLWSDEARAAALEARRNASEHYQKGHEHRDQADKFRRAGNDEASKYHASAAKFHVKAGQRFDEAAKHYQAGNKEAGDRKSTAAYQTLSTRDDDNDYIDCPNCGAEIPAGTRDCPECHYHMNTNDGVYTMPKIIAVDGLNVSVMDEQGASIIERHVAKLETKVRDHKTRVTDAEAAAEKAKKDLADAQKALSTKDGEIAVLKKQVADAAITPVKLDQMVKDRLVVIEAAAPILDKSFAFDGKSVEEIKRATVDAFLGDAAKGMDDVAVAGAFVAATAVKDGRRGGSQPIRDALRQSGGHRPGGAEGARESAYDERVKNLSDGWRKKPAA